LRLDPVANGHGGDVAIDYVRLLTRVDFGDLNGDGAVTSLDVDPFVGVLLGGDYQAPADMNRDHVVNGMDVDLFVATLVRGRGHGTGSVVVVPEPSFLAFATTALVLVVSRRRQRRA
jgi:hypothetical protein